MEELLKGTTIRIGQETERERRMRELLTTGQMRFG